MFRTFAESFANAAQGRCALYRHASFESTLDAFHRIKLKIVFHVHPLHHLSSPSRWYSSLKKLGSHATVFTKNRQ